MILSWALLAFLAMRIADRVSASTGLTIILIGAAALRAALLFEPPYLSSDMYRYVWDGRVQGSGVNPYAYVPAAPELMPLRDNAIYSNVNRADYAPTIYPPVAQMIFLLITRFGESVITMKLGLLAFEAIALLAMIGLLRAVDMPATRVVAYAWHPLPTWEIAGNGHVDAVLVGLVLTALWLSMRGRVLSAGLFVSLAVFVKPTALLAMPVLWRPWNLKLPAILLGVTALVYVPYLSAGRRVLGFLPGYIQEEELNSGGGFRYLGLLQQLTGPIPGGVVLYLSTAMLVITMLALKAGFRADRSPSETLRWFGVLLITFLVLLTPHYPWYYLAIAPFLALGTWVTPWVLTTGGFILYNVMEGDRMPPFALREALLHLTVLGALTYDFWPSRRSSMALQTGELRQ